MREPYFSHHGVCPICEKEVVFTADFAWYRDHLFCSECHSLPRERALMEVLKEHYPDYKDRAIIEVGLEPRALSLKLSKMNKNHSFIQIVNCATLEKLQGRDKSLDIIITHDVMNHVLKPRLVLREIARVLKFGGAHIFTVPMVNKTQKTTRRAEEGCGGKINHKHTEQYWGNYTKPGGPLVTMDWGYDIGNFILGAVDMPTILTRETNQDKGIMGDLNEVVVSFRRN